MQDGGVVIVIVIISAGEEGEGPQGVEVPSPAPSLLQRLLTNRQDASASQLDRQKRVRPKVLCEDITNNAGRMIQKEINGPKNSKETFPE